MARSRDKEHINVREQRRRKKFMFTSPIKTAPSLQNTYPLVYQTKEFKK